MCIAIGKPKGLFINRETLFNCYTNNDDGIGYAFVNPSGQVIVRKFMSFDTFYTEYSMIDRAFGDISDMLIHFRITSRGETRLGNCHPFQINEKSAFIHNGTISSMPVDKEHGHSDTYWFNELIFKELPENWEDNTAIKALIEETIGFSKIVLLHAEKGLIIFNEDKGLWHDGCWYSNSSYEKRRVVYAGNTNYNYNRGSSRYINDYWDDEDFYEKWNTLPDKSQSKVIDINTNQGIKLIGNSIESLIEDQQNEADNYEEKNTSEILCDLCLTYHPLEDIYFIDGGQRSIQLVCETCVIQAEEAGMQLTYHTMTEEDYADYLQMNLKREGI